jgi:hypothetical protein
MVSVQVAFRFTLRKAIVFSLLWVAFSSSRFCCKTDAHSLRPSMFAHADGPHEAGDTAELPCPFF